MTVDAYAATRSASPSRGALAVLMAAVLFGSTGTAQALGPTGLDPLAVGAARVVLAGLLLFGLAWRRGAYRAVPRPRLAVLLPAALGVAFYQVGFFTGVHLAGVAVGTVVALGSGPVWTGLIDWVVTHRRPSLTWLAATVLAVVGVGVLVLSNAGGASAGSVVPGLLAALLAGLGYGMYTVNGSRLIAEGQSATGSMGLLFGVGAAVLLPVLLVRWPGGLASAGGLAVVGYLALVPTVLAYVLFGIGLRVLPAATVATLTLAEPVVATLLGVTVLDEPFTAGGLVGALLVLGGLSLLALPADVLRRARRPVDAVE